MMTVVAVVLLIPPGTILARHGGGSSHGGGSHSGSHSSGSRSSGSGSRSFSHSGSRSTPSDHGGTHPGHGGSHLGHGGGHGAYHHHWHPYYPIPFGPVFWGPGWYAGGYSWLWSDWNRWTPATVLLLPDNDVDVYDSEMPVDAEEDDPDQGAGPDQLGPTPARFTSAIVFDVYPDDAVIYVDDHFEGTAADLGGAEGGLSLPPGQHLVTIARPGLRDVTITVVTRDGKATNVDTDLTR